MNLILRSQPTKEETEQYLLTNRKGIVTCTNLAKPEPRGDPLYKAMDAPFNNEAYTSQGPIIHPRLVGQATISPLRISMWHHASAAALKGVTLVHGIAFGSPTQENNTSHTCQHLLVDLFNLKKIVTFETT